MYVCMYIPTGVIEIRDSIFCFLAYPCSLIRLTRLSSVLKLKQFFTPTSYDSETEPIKTHQNQSRKSMKLHTFPVPLGHTLAE